MARIPGKKGAPLASEETWVDLMHDLRGCLLASEVHVVVLALRRRLFALEVPMTLEQVGIEKMVALNSEK